MDVDQLIIDLACNNISQEAPCGINAKYELVYENLEIEIAKSESLSNDATDWKNVLDFSTTILGTISKDYSTACYLAYSLVHRDGYKGLLAGSILLEKLSETYWDDMFPAKKRLRGRQNATQWFIEKTGAYLEHNEPSSNDMLYIPDIAKTVKNLDYFLSDKMEDKAPNFSELSRPLKRLKEIANSQASKDSEAVKPDSKPVVTAISEVVQDIVKKVINPKVKIIEKPTTDIEPIGDISNDSDAKKALKQVQDGLRKLASYHGQVDASDPKRFRLSRSALWDNLDKLPPTKANKSQLPCPPTDKLKKVIDLYELGDYEQAINLAEKSAEKMPYWFDGNRYISLSLDALGSQYEKAKRALEIEISTFTKRLPSIIELEYANGTPFANEQTKLWISSLASNSSDTVISESTDHDVISIAFSEAKKLAISGKISDGFTLLNNCQSNTKRDHFKIKMACAELACINGQAKVGIPMLERLIEETKNLKVADWESDFLSKAFALLVNAYEKLNASDASKKQIQKDAAYAQLCWYNPALLTSNS
jgi:type VI secretion system protein VasJ